MSGVLLFCLPLGLLALFALIFGLCRAAAVEVVREDTGDYHAS